MVIRLSLRQIQPFLTIERCRPLLNRSTSPRYSSNLSHLHDEMVSRRLPYITDYITPTQTERLKLTLQNFLPSANEGSQPLAYQAREESNLSPAHHLVYFPNVQPTFELLSDGTDPSHSPGPPFTRTMWAGGSMAFPHDIMSNGKPFHCTEKIEHVGFKGDKGKERIFVKIKRLITASIPPMVHVTEHRTLVFMRDNLHEGSPTFNQSSRNVLKPTQTPDFSHTIIPTPQLLFRFSALTFNAHAIHLDKAYCRDVEGHRNLLVHGPLTVVLMIEVLQSYLQTLTNNRGPEKVKRIDYRNLAPLYAEEPMRVCVRRNKRGDQGETIAWDVWIEGRDGGYAVKGLVRTSDHENVGFRLRKHVFRDGTTTQEHILDQETIPKEHIALQSEINATQRWGERGGYSRATFSAEEKTELEAEEVVEEEAGK